MPWFPDFIAAAELARREVRAAGQADPVAVRLIPEHLARQAGLLALRREAGTLDVAVGDPLDVVSLDHLRALTGCALKVWIARPSQVREAVDEFYQQIRSSEKVGEILDHIDLTPGDDEEEVDLATLRQQVEDAPVVRLVNLILAEATPDHAGLAATVAAARTRLVALRPEAAELADQFAFLAPDPIPLAVGSPAGGNPARSGPFTVRLRFPSGYRVMPHWHPTSEHVTVLGGTFKVGMGNAFDESAMTTVHEGGFGVPKQRLRKRSQGYAVVPFSRWPCQRCRWNRPQHGRRERQQIALHGRCGTMTCGWPWTEP